MNNYILANLSSFPEVKQNLNRGMQKEKTTEKRKLSRLVSNNCEKRVNLFSSNIAKKPKRCWNIYLIKALEFE